MLKESKISVPKELITKRATDRIEMKLFHLKGKFDELVFKYRTVFVFTCGTHI